MTTSPSKPTNKPPGASTSKKKPTAKKTKAKAPISKTKAPIAKTSEISEEITSKQTPASETPQETPASEAKKKTVSARSKTVLTSEITEYVPDPEALKKTPAPKITRMLITSETIEKIPIAVLVEKRSMPETLKKKAVPAPLPATVEQEPVFESPQNISISERIKGFSIPESVKQFSVSGFIRNVSISESIGNTSAAATVTDAPLSNTAENTPDPLTLGKTSVSEIMGKTAILEHIRKIPTPDILRKIPVPALIKNIPISEISKRIPGSEIVKKVSFSKINERLAATEFDNQDAALFLRVGMGLLFIIGGCSKLSQLLDPAYASGLVMSYTGTSGYINEVFLSFLFPGGSSLTPWGFLTALSYFELVTGIALVAGFLVRPLALIYAFLLWTFVFSLPVATTPGVELTVKTYTSPAMFVQVRDIALSGMMFVLYQLGSGRRSVDSLFIVNANDQSEQTNWDKLGLLLRLSVALPLLIGALFGAYGNITTFASPSWMMLVISLLLIAGVKVRDAAALTMVIMVWYIMTKLTLDKSLIGNLNGFKRELALFAGALVLFGRGGGNSYTPADFSRRIRTGLSKTPLVAAAI